MDIEFSVRTPDSHVVMRRIGRGSWSVELRLASAPTRFAHRLYAEVCGLLAPEDDRENGNEWELS